MTHLLDHALRQLARIWSGRTQVPGGLTFAEPLSGAFTPANIYAKALPNLGHRLASACSLRYDGDIDQDGIAIRAIVRCEAHAPSLAEARLLLDDLSEVMRPGGSPFVVAGAFNDGTAALAGVLGLTPVIDAAAGGTTIDIFKIIGIDIDTGTQDLSPELGPASTEDGQASATLSLLVLMVKTTLEAPVAAFEISRVGGAVNAVVDIRDDSIGIGWTDAVLNSETFDYITYPTVGQLRVAINAVSGWDTINIDNSFDARDSRSVFASGIKDALAGDVAARVWA